MLARERASILLSQPPPPVLLHGDLENKNILYCAKRGLVAIDPLPSIGEPAYDVGYWLAATVELEQRDLIANTLGHALQLDSGRIRAWATVVALEP
jgi:streptomycin 6-kinase